MLKFQLISNLPLPIQILQHPNRIQFLFVSSSRIPEKMLLKGKDHVHKLLVNCRTNSIHCFTINKKCSYPISP